MNHSMVLWPDTTLSAMWLGYLSLENTVDTLPAKANILVQNCQRHLDERDNHGAGTFPVAVRSVRSAY